MVDWGAGNYERTAVELEPVAEAVVGIAALSPGDAVLDLACGTGNAALLASSSGAHVVGVDSAPRLLDVARERAQAQRAKIDFREGDLLALPVGDGEADVVISVFGVIFAADPSAALGEVRRVMRPPGRALITAWVPAGPIHAMLASTARIIARVTEAPARARFPWSDRAAVQRIARDVGLALDRTTSSQLPIRDSSPEAYVAGGRNHPVSLAVRPVLRQAGAELEAQEAMLAILRNANEDPDGFLIHSPYVVHELRIA
jgi:SAM-dependent methyltransferase